MVARVPTAAMMMPVREPVLRPLLEPEPEEEEGESGDDADVGVEAPPKMSLVATVGKSVQGGESLSVRRAKTVARHSLVGSEGWRLECQVLTVGRTRRRRRRHSSIRPRRGRERQDRPGARAAGVAVADVLVAEGGAAGVEEAARGGGVAAAEDAGVDGGAAGAVEAVAAAEAGAEVGAGVVVAQALDRVAARPAHHVLHRRDAVVARRAGQRGRRVAADVAARGDGAGEEEGRFSDERVGGRGQGEGGGGGGAGWGCECRGDCGRSVGGSG